MLLTYPKAHSDLTLQCTHTSGHGNTCDSGKELLGMKQHRLGPESTDGVISCKCNLLTENVGSVLSYSLKRWLRSLVSVLVMNQFRVNQVRRRWTRSLVTLHLSLLCCPYRRGGLLQVGCM